MTADARPTAPRLPARLRLAAFRPNPTLEAGASQFDVPAASAVEITLCDPAGRRIRSIVHAGRATAGANEAMWDGLDDPGRPVGSGIDLDRVRTGRDACTGRVVVFGRMSVPCGRRR